MRCGWSPAVEDELLEGEPADLAAHGVEARQQHRFGRVVDDDVHAGDGLEGADVAALATDDPSLHLLGRQVQHADDGLGGLLAGDALDGLDDDRSGPVGALAAGLVLDRAHQQCGIAPGRGFHDGQQLGLCLLGGQASHPFQLAFVRSRPGIQSGRTLVELAGESVQGLLPLAQLAQRALEVDGLGLQAQGLGVQAGLRVVQARLLCGEIVFGAAGALGDAGDFELAVASCLGEHRRRLVGGIASHRLRFGMRCAGVDLGRAPNGLGLCLCGPAHGIGLGLRDLTDRGGLRRGDAPGRLDLGIPLDGRRGAFSGTDRAATARVRSHEQDAQDEYRSDCRIPDPLHRCLLSVATVGQETRARAAECGGPEWCGTAFLCGAVNFYVLPTSGASRGREAPTAVEALLLVTRG